MSPLVETVLFVFGLIALGYVAGISGYVRMETGDALAEFAVGVAVPVLLFRTIVTADFEGTEPWGLWAAYFTGVVVTWAAGHLAVTRLLGRDSATGVVAGVCSAFSNTVLLGIPFMLGVYGHGGVEVLSLIVSVHLVVMMMASIVLFEIVGGGPAEAGRWRVLAGVFARRLFANAMVLGILAGLAWRFVGPPMPHLLTRLVDAMANVAGPLALFAIGVGLRKFGIVGHVRAALVLSALKLVLMPGLVLAMAWLLGLPPLTAKVAVATASMPSGANSYLIAVQFRTGQALASSQMTMTTAAAVVTTALWLVAAHAVFG